MGVNILQLQRAQVLYYQTWRKIQSAQIRLCMEEVGMAKPYALTVSPRDLQPLLKPIPHTHLHIPSFTYALRLHTTAETNQDHLRGCLHCPLAVSHHVAKLPPTTWSTLCI